MALRSVCLIDVCLCVDTTHTGTYSPHLHTHPNWNINTPLCVCCVTEAASLHLSFMWRKTQGLDGLYCITTVESIVLHVISYTMGLSLAYCLINSILFSVSVPLFAPCLFFCYNHLSGNQGCVSRNNRIDLNELISVCGRYRCLRTQQGVWSQLDGHNVLGRASPQSTPL